MAAAPSPARIRPRSTARPPMPRAISPRTSSPAASPTAAPSRSPTRSASSSRCRSMSTCTAPARSRRRSWRQRSARRWTFRPRGIRQHLQLNRPIYRRTASYGHFGRAPEKDGGFSWERTDLVKEIEKRALLAATRACESAAAARSSAGAREGAPAGAAAGDRDSPSEAADRPVASRRPSRSRALSTCRSTRSGWRSASAAASISCTPRATNPGIGFIGVEPFESGLAKAVDGDRARGDPKRPALRSGCGAAARLAAARIDHADRSALPRPVAEEAALEAPVRQARPISTASRACLRAGRHASASRPTSRAMPNGRARGCAARRLSRHARQRGIGAVGGLARHALRGEGGAPGAPRLFHLPQAAMLSRQRRRCRRGSKRGAAKTMACAAAAQAMAALPAQPHDRRPAAPQEHACTGRSVRITPASAPMANHVSDRHADKSFARGEPEQAAQRRAVGDAGHVAELREADAAAPDAKPAAAAGEDRARHRRRAAADTRWSRRPSPALATTTRQSPALAVVR